MNKLGNQCIARVVQPIGK